MRKALVGVTVVVLGAPASALAHVERPAFWPDPAPDTSIKPAAGGAVPKARSLASALNRKLPGDTRVVCQKDSLELLRASVGAARKNGYAIRPSDVRRLGKAQARRLLELNAALFKRCRYSEIQPAVTASGNEDRVVIMPGLYLEPTARAQPTHDPRCKDLKTAGDRPGEEGNALTYAYQVTCPNDQNLIAVMGRAIGAGKDPSPPPMNRHGIPNLGPCVRCNLQIEGSGVSADDVVIDAGDASKGNGGPNGAGSKKDVVIRADRADGFVLRNVTTRHAGEHGIYVLESDGYLLDRFKTYYSRLYGTLTFVEDHGVQQNCEAVGNGDSGIYPGAALESGYQRPPGTRFRLNQQIRFCDMHGNLAGYSGTNGNAVHVHHNNIYGNALGLQTDVVTGAGHPGYPGDSMLVEDNNIYSNNFNPYAANSPVKPAFPFPVGTGMWIAGGNHHLIRNNHFWDNWRRGTMLFSVPDSLVCGEANGGNQQAGCDSTKVSTSHYNQTYDNIMGQTPGGKTDRNGTDFWWDDFAGSRGNCWFRNSGPRPITSAPSQIPGCDDGKDPAMSLGKGDATQEAELLGCFTAFESRNFEQPSTCAWLTPPTDPGDGDAAMGSPSPSTSPLTTFPAARAGATPRRYNVPLGQLSCADWNAAQTDQSRDALIGQVQGFVGGVVVDGEKQLGSGAVLTSDEAHRVYDGWCGYQFASGFLLYKLYSHAAAFAPRG